MKSQIDLKGYMGLSDDTIFRWLDKILITRIIVSNSKLTNDCWKYTA